MTSIVSLVIKLNYFRIYKLHQTSFHLIVTLKTYSKKERRRQLLLTIEAVEKNEGSYLNDCKLQRVTLEC